MTEAEKVPAETFPRLYDPERSEQIPLKVHSLSGAVPLLESEGPPLFNLRIASGLFEPQYLVMLHGTDTDLPLSMFTDRDEAVRFAQNVRDNPEAYAERFLELIRAEPSPKRYRWLSISIVEYTGPIPTARTPLFDLD